MAGLKVISALTFWFVACQTPHQANAVCSHGSVRLVDANGAINDGAGRLEICINNVWGTVCDDGFTNTNAQVVCRQLGASEHSNYIGAVARPSFYYGQGNGSIWLDDVSCNGSESSLLQCSHNGIGSHNCFHFEDVGVLCLGSIVISGTIILSRNNITSNSYYFGVVRVFSGGWGNICDDSWYSYNEANVICHQLGYTGVSTFSRAGLTSYGTDYLSMKWDDVDCSSSNYLSITQCTYSTIIDSGCVNSNSYDATVSCYTTRIWNSNPFPGMVRLQGGDYSNQGRVEVYCNGQWGTICNSGFNVTDSDTICQQLGYDYAAYYNHLALSGSSGQAIWSTNMTSSSSDTCYGTGNTCPAASISSCTHAHDVTVSCGEFSVIIGLTVTDTTCSGLIALAPSVPTPTLSTSSTSTTTSTTSTSTTASSTSTSTTTSTSTSTTTSSTSTSTTTSSTSSGQVSTSTSSIISKKLTPETPTPSPALALWAIGVISVAGGVILAIVIAVVIFLLCCCFCVAASAKKRDEYEMNTEGSKL